MKKNQKVIDLISILKEYYPDAKCSLNFKTPFELVISVILAAQCTDERVNKTTPPIFNKYSTPEDFATIDLKLLEKLIHPCGFYRNKAKSIKECSKKLLEDFNGEVPNGMDELLTLPGIGRKSANVILLDAYGICVGIAVDTHAKRVSNRIGLSSESDPQKIEKDLIAKIPNEYLKDVNHLFVWHGRNTCTARNPKCDICPVSKYCNFLICSNEVSYR